MTSVLRSREKLLGPVDPTHGGAIALLALCFITGMIDAAVFNNYSVFAGMQTGNTVILCLSTAKYPASNPLAYATTLVSLASFLAGAFATYHLPPFLLQPLKLPKPSLYRPVVTLNFLLQGILILITAALTQTNLIPSAASSPSNPDAILSDPRIIAAIPPLAFQSGAAMSTSRILGFGGEIPVNVLTSTYAALATDPNVWRLRNKARDRRVTAIACVAAGAICSAWIMRRTEEGLATVLWLGGAVKVVVAIGVGLGLKPEEGVGELGSG